MALRFLRSLCGVLILHASLLVSVSLAETFKVGDLVYREEDSPHLAEVLEVKDAQVKLRFRDEDENPPAWVATEGLRPMEQEHREEWGRYLEHRKEVLAIRAKREAEAKIRETREKLDEKPANRVYALSNGNLYFRGVRGEKKGTKSLIYWEDDEEPTWVENRLIRPRKNHGLKRTQIGDNPPSKEQLAADALAKEKKAMEARVKCPRLKTAADCLSSFLPCGWHGVEQSCEYQER